MSFINILIIVALFGASCILLAMSHPRKPVAVKIVTKPIYNVIEIKKEEPTFDSIPLHGSPQCLGLQDVRQPSDEKEEYRRRYIVDFVDKVKAHLMKTYPDNPVAARVISTWQGRVEIFNKDNVLFFPDHGCFYFNPNIFDYFTFDELHTMIIHEITKPSNCDANESKEWEDACRFLCDIVWLELHIACRRSL